MMNNEIKAMLNNKNVKFQFVDTINGKGIAVSREENAKIAKVFYLEAYQTSHEMFRDIQFYLTTENDDTQSDVLEFGEKIEIYDKVKDKLFLVLGRNTKDGIYEPVYDFYKFVYILEDDMKTRVTENLLKIWNISKEEAFRQAEKNIRKREIQFIGIEELISKLTGEENKTSKELMYVLTYKPESSYGATILLDKGVLKQVAERLEEDFYIIPSSVHELIIVPSNDKHNGWELKRMLRTVNRELVEANEQLSYSMFFYNRKSAEIDMI